VATWLFEEGFCCVARKTWPSPSLVRTVRLTFCVGHLRFVRHLLGSLSQMSHEVLHPRDWPSFRLVRDGICELGALLRTPALRFPDQSSCRAQTARQRPLNASATGPPTTSIYVTTLSKRQFDAHQLFFQDSSQLGQQCVTLSFRPNAIWLRTCQPLQVKIGLRSKSTLCTRGTHRRY
jgi:hypothetical protein